MVTPDIPRAMAWTTAHSLYRPEAYALSGYFDVILNGEIVSGVAAYDCDKGYIVRFKRDQEGRKVLDIVNRVPLFEVTVGVVEIFRRQ